MIKSLIQGWAEVCELNQFGLSRTAEGRRSCHFGAVGFSLAIFLPKRDLGLAQTGHETLFSHFLVAGRASGRALSSGSFI